MGMSIFNENKIQVFEEIDSTNDLCYELTKSDYIEEGTIIRAINQIKGKGQKGNKWESENDKNLTFSILLKPNQIQPANQFILNQAISLSMIDFIKSITKSDKIKIKWPNDIYFGEKKIAGILIETQIMGNQIENAIIGIGLNVNQLDFKNHLPNPISLKQITQIDYNLDNLLIDFLPFIELHIDQLYEKDFKNIETIYMKNLLYFNYSKLYKVNNKIINAKIVGISKFGKLILQINSDIKIECDFKEVEFIH